LQLQARQRKIDEELQLAARVQRSLAAAQHELWTAFRSKRSTSRCTRSAAILAFRPAARSPQLLGMRRLVPRHRLGVLGQSAVHGGDVANREPRRIRPDAEAPQSVRPPFIPAVA
jgi:hypothetical protein